MNCVTNLENLEQPRVDKPIFAPRVTSNVGFLLHMPQLSFMVRPMNRSLMLGLSLLFGCSSSSTPKTTAPPNIEAAAKPASSAAAQPLPTSSAQAVVAGAESAAPPRPGDPPLADTIAPKPSETMQADVTYSPGFDVMHPQLDKLLVFTSNKGRLPHQFGVAQGDKVVRAPHLAAGLATLAQDPLPADQRNSAPYRIYIRELIGEFPKDAYLLLDRMNPDARPSRNVVVMHWDRAKNVWTEMKNHAVSQQATIPPFDGVVHWEMPPENIRLHLAPFPLEPLALIIAGRAGDPIIAGLAKGDTTMYKLARCKKDCVVDRSLSMAHKECKTLLDPSTILAEGGSVWVFGERCTDGAPAMEGFPSNEYYVPGFMDPGTFSILPSNLIVHDGTVLEEKTDIVVVGSRIARWNGTAWTPIARPPEMNISVPGFALAAVAADTKGTLWIADPYGEKVWRRKPDGSWSWLALPKAALSTNPSGPAVSFIPWDIHVTLKGEVWVTGCRDGARFHDEEGVYEDDEQEKAVKADCGAYFVKPK